MPETKPERRLAAVLAADFVGYSKLMSLDEEGTVRLVRDLQSRTIEPTIAEHRGRLVKWMGDGLLAEFASVIDAIGCALEIQKMLREREAGDNELQQLQLRIGVNLGDIIIENDDIYGDGVNIAARLEALADPGGILVSGSVFDHADGKVAGTFHDSGRQTVKNIANPIRTYALLVGEMPRTVARSQRSTNAKRMVPWLAGIGLTLLLLGLAFDFFYSGSVPPRADTKRVVVFPFESLSAEEDDFFADGLTEELANQLAKIPEIGVIAKSSVAQFQQGQYGLDQIAEQLGAGTLLEGSVRKQGDAVRIVARLIDVQSQTQTWSQEYDRELADIFDVQEDIAEQVAGNLKVKLLPETRDRLADLGTDDPEVYQLYLEGLHALNFRSKTSIEEARNHFVAALERDPQFARAMAGLSEYYAISREFTDVTTNEARNRSLDLAERAVAIDPYLSNAWVYIALARIYQHDWDGAQHAFERAIDANPSYAPAHNQYGHKLLLVVQSRNDQALAELQRAIGLDPLSRVARVNLGFALYHLERHEDAAAHFRKMLETDPDYLFAHVGLGQSLIWLGELAEGIASIEYAADLVDRPAWIMGFVGWAYAKAGRDIEARAILADLEQRRAAGNARALPLARIHMALGDLDAAFQRLDEAYAANDPNLIYLRMPEFHRELAPDPSYFALLRRMGLKDPDIRDPVKLPG